MSRYVGILREKKFGENPETSSYKPKFINVGSCSLDAASDVYMDDETMEETPRRAKKGFYSPEGEMEQNLDLPTAPYFLEALMGEYIFDKAPTTPPSPAHPDTDNLNAHHMYVGAGRRLPSYSIYVGKENEQATGGDISGGFEHCFHGCVADSGSFEISDGFAKYNLSFKARKDTQANLRPDSELLIDEEFPLAFYEVQAFMGERTMKNVSIKPKTGATINNVPLAVHNFTEVSSKTQSFTWELSNDADPSSGQRFGSMFASRILANKKEPTLSTNVDFEGARNLRLLWGLDPNDTTVGAGATGKTKYFSYKFMGKDENNNIFEMLFPKLVFNTVPQALEGGDLIEQELDIKVLKDKVLFGRPETLPNLSVESPVIDLSKGCYVVDTSCVISVYNTSPESQRPA